MADQTVSYSQTSIPDYAKPYVESMLGRAQSLTDVNQNPYQSYGGERVAAFSPLQMQSFQGIAGLNPSSYMQSAGQGLAGLAGAASGYQYAPTNIQTYQMGPAQQVRTQSFTMPGVSSQYMSPYMQDVVDAQKREAVRDANIQRTQNNANAVGKGAFGGSRQAIVDAELNRNTQQRLGDIQAQGLQAAYQQGQGQFNTEQQARLAAQQANQQAGLTVGTNNLNAAMNAQQLREQANQYGAGLGLQGLQTGLNAYNSLGSYGTNLLGMQNQFGTQQQQQAQNVLSTNYQDFLNQQNYPYKQLSYMSDMLRGVPLSQQSNSVYQSPPSMLSQVAGLGTAALGASKLFAEGGLARAALNRMMEDA